jgi:hypothetical protein
LLYNILKRVAVEELWSGTLPLIYWFEIRMYVLFRLFFYRGLCPGFFMLLIKMVKFYIHLPILFCYNIIAYASFQFYVCVFHTHTGGGNLAGPPQGFYFSKDSSSSIF